MEILDIMKLETRKIGLINWLSQLQDEETINKLESLRDEKQDWWNTISDEERAQIEEGLSQANKGEVIPHDKVMEKYKKWL